MLGRQFKLLGLMQYFLLAVKDLNVSVVTACLHISHLVPPSDLQQPFFFLRGPSFALTRMSFKVLAFLNPIIVTFSKSLPCSVSGVSGKCISDSIFLSFENTG